MGPPPAKQRFHKQQAWKAEINVPGKAPLPLRSKYTKQGEIGIYLKQDEARACDSTLVHAKDSPLSCNDTKSSIWLKMKKAMGHVYSLLHGTCRHRTIGGIRDGWGINKATRSNPLPFPCIVLPRLLNGCMRLFRFDNNIAWISANWVVDRLVRWVSYKESYNTCVSSHWLVHNYRNTSTVSAWFHFPSHLQSR